MSYQIPMFNAPGMDNIPFAAPITGQQLAGISTAGGASSMGGSSGYAPTTSPAPVPNPKTAAPAAAGGGWFQNLGGMEGLGTIFQGLGSLGQIYTAMQGLKLAKQQFGFQKDAYQENLANQKMTYNTALEDRINSRFAAENKSSAAAADYIAQHKL